MIPKGTDFVVFLKFDTTIASPLVLEHNFKRLWFSKIKLYNLNKSFWSIHLSFWSIHLSSTVPCDFLKKFPCRRWLNSNKIKSLGKFNICYAAGPSSQLVINKTESRNLSLVSNIHETSHCLPIFTQPLICTNHKPCYHAVHNYMFVYAIGAGVYLTAALYNHSCDPRYTVQYTVAFILALCLGIK